MIKKPVRVRMAPSPTGYLHIGGARTALFNYLFAKHYGGDFILRIEDTDKERSKKEYEDDIITDLRWMGVDWDEGPQKDGKFGPYYQSQRQDIYDKYRKKLVGDGKVYSCYCTPEELEQERKALLQNRQTPRYMGKCRELTKDQRAAFENEGRKPVLRYRIDETDMVEFNDLIRGTIKVDPQILGDFVISKSDGGPVYNFASVVDDSVMEMTHIIRGEEHISNTPRQVLLMRALGFKPPEYAHVSIILAPDRTKLSKRYGATALGDYMKQGFLADALFNYLVLLGWNPGDEREIMDRKEIIDCFTIDRVIKSPAIFDVTKLSWMNGMYIRKRPIEEVVKHTVPYLEKEGYDLKSKDPKWVEKMIDATRGYLERFDQIGQHVGMFFDEKFSLDEKLKERLLKNKKESIEVLKVLDEILSDTKEIDKEVFEEIQKELKSKVTVKPKILFQTQRIALTGQTSGPEMVLVIPILGVESCRKRIKKTLAQLK